MENNLLEKLADLEHQQWIELMKYLLKILSSEKETGNNLQRWREQISTPYSKLSETDKEKDRVFARKVLSLIQEQIQNRTTLDDDVVSITKEAIKSLYKKMNFPEHQIERLMLGFVKNQDNGVTLDIIAEAIELTQWRIIQKILQHKNCTCMHINKKDNKEMTCLDIVLEELGYLTKLNGGFFSSQP